MKRIRLSELRELIKEEMTDPSLDGNDSLDAQIDRFLVEYESEAKHSMSEGVDFRSLVRRLLSEGDDDEEAPDESKQQDLKLGIDSINVDSFSDSVARLIQSYDNLLEVKNTILRRAMKFLTKTYDESVIEKFKSDVRENYGLEIGKSKSDMENDYFRPPPARGAGPDGA